MVLRFAIYLYFVGPGYVLVGVGCVRVLLLWMWHLTMGFGLRVGGLALE